MGIRVDPDALRRQLDEAGCPERAGLPFHKMLLAGELPLTMGGGIGQSRLWHAAAGQGACRRRTGELVGQRDPRRL